MSEEIRLKDLMPNEFYVNDIGLFCCELSIKEVNRIANVLTNLQQENQQLKEELKECEESEDVIFNQTDFWVDKYHEVRHVLDEIREYIETKLRDVNLTYGIDNEFRQEYDDLLQILDKVKE